MPFYHPPPIFSFARWASAILFNSYNFAISGQAVMNADLPNGVPETLQDAVLDSYYSWYYVSIDIHAMLLNDIGFWLFSHWVEAAVLAWGVVETGLIMKMVRDWLKERKRKAEGVLSSKYGDPNRY
ncbi:MAG: hypothetical protein AAF291_12885 [Pseudomonadota bacterium]